MGSEAPFHSASGLSSVLVASKELHLVGPIENRASGALRAPQPSPGLRRCLVSPAANASTLVLLDGFLAYPWK